LKTLKIALIGCGAMGRLVGALAENKRHEIVITINKTDSIVGPDELARKLRGADVAIDFSVASAVPVNVEACLAAGVPLVEGTTGWNSETEKIRTMVLQKGGAFVFGANFSPGVNIFYRVVRFASELFSKFDGYEAFIEEQHHSRKVDAPSGTALKLKEIVSQSIEQEISISSTRAGSIPGTHRVGFDGTADQVLLEHFARSRDGFAAGAVLAAEWIIGKTGFYEFTDVVDEILK
jgi:4-hydroxy-tetrahydrodipicolinate reductase